jgi:nucleolar protein 4
MSDDDGGGEEEEEEEEDDDDDDGDGNAGTDEDDEEDEDGVDLKAKYMKLNAVEDERKRKREAKAAAKAAAAAAASGDSDGDGDGDGDDADADAVDGEEGDAAVEAAKEEPAKKSDVTEGRTLFVRGLPFDMEEMDLKRRFRAFGAVSYAKIVRDRATGVSKGTGFVQVRRQYRRLSVCVVRVCGRLVD